MSFIGKKYKGVEMENMVEFLDDLNLSEKTRAMLKMTNGAIIYFVRSGDDMSYIVEANGTKISEQKFTLGKESDFTIPDGIVTKNLFTLDGETLTQVMKFPDGKIITAVRKFNGDALRLDVSASYTDKTGAIIYKAV